MAKYYTVETQRPHTALSELVGKTVETITKVNCDEGFTIHFTDGTKLEVGYSGCEGVTAINGKEINVEGIRANG